MTNQRSWKKDDQLEEEQQVVHHIDRMINRESVKTKATN